MRIATKRDRMVTYCERPSLLKPHDPLRRDQREKSISLLSPYLRPPDLAGCLTLARSFSMQVIIDFLLFISKHMA